MAYTYISMAGMVTALRGYLGDNETVKFWSDSELRLILIESLRTFNCLARYSRSKGSFATSSTETFYDLRSKFPTLFGFTVTHAETTIMVENALMEPEGVTAWVGTDMFALAEIIGSIERRRNQFLVETGCVLTLTNLYSGATGTGGKIPLDEREMDIRAAHWKDVNGLFTPIFRDDERSAGRFYPRWTTTPAKPTSFSTFMDNSPHVQLMPPPSDVGEVELITTRSGDPITVGGAAAILGIPDDFSWVIKWGVLADLLSTDPQAKDDTRAEYCMKRWDEGIELARNSISVLNASVDERPVPDDSLDDVMKFNSGWRNTRRKPTSYAMAGQHLIAVAPAADGVYGVGLDLWTKFPIPTSDADPLDIGREFVDAILSYAQHVAAFKQGGAEFTATIGEYKQMLKVAALQNDRLSAMAFYRAEMEAIGQLQNLDRPRLEVESVRA